MEHLEQQRKSFQRQHKKRAEEEAEEEKKCEKQKETGAQKETVDTNSKETPGKYTSGEVRIDSLSVIRKITTLIEDPVIISH